jgi:hypothetical protein
MMTPHTVHHGHDRQLTEERGITLMAAFAAHPERFKGKHSGNPVLSAVI